ncbi:MAG: hypothetical protein ACRDA8_05080, partial [Shewanella sp.]
MNKYLLAITAILLTGCGSDGASTDTTPPLTVPAKINGTVTQVSPSHEVITVNGYSVNIANAKISYGQQALETGAIDVGMRVNIEHGLTEA